MASSVTAESGCGSKEYPWIITVQPGQRINITLYDFSVEKTYHVKRINDIGSFDVERNICQEYAVIHEIETEWNTMVCGGNTRVQHIYLSKSNALRIEVTNSAHRHFMLKYEGRPTLAGPHTVA